MTSHLMAKHCFCPDLSYRADCESYLSREVSSCCSVDPGQEYETRMVNFGKTMTKSFLYFAYGSNLLTQRIHINNPSAVRKDIGKLMDYRLDFGQPFSKKWDGCPATVVPHTGKHVWGSIWEIDHANISDLDRQEGVPQNIYFPIQVSIQTESGKTYNCRSYQLCKTPEAEEVLPPERQPSQIYLDVIIKGAIESGLPTSYIEELKRIPNNGSKGNLETPISFPSEFT
ncbi:gamma-glutamylcyclotransferase-like isoform X2 [Periplaneta americana]|uniref:gamma-glutamylcyclotransferase-like isoform X2 n=1 Tax=Periplaneta americana TaxID=6978 RepID=UPI0037E78EF5